MNYKWFIIGMCLLITACNGTAEDPKKDENPTDGKAAQTADDTAKEVAKTQDEQSDEKAEENSNTEEAEGNPVDAIAKKLDDARKEFMTAYQKASAEEKAKMTSKYPQASQFADEIKEIAKTTEDSDVAAAAYVWLASNSRNDEKAQNEAYDVLFEKYSDSPRMKEICMGFVYAKPSDSIEKRLTSLIESSPHNDVKALANFALASYLRRVEESKASVNDERMAAFMGKEAIEFIKEFELDPARVESLLQTVVDKYPDATMGTGERTRSISEMAASTLFEIKNLSVGCEAPDIEGVDLDGTEFKLSDYRGKVVMLDFWGDW